MSERRSAYSAAAAAVVAGRAVRPRRRRVLPADPSLPPLSADDTAARERQLLALCHAEMRERDVERVVIGLCELYDWLHHHTTDSRRSARGYPDWTAVKANRPLLFLELKTTRGRVRKEQLVWLAALSGRAEVVARVVRPADVPALNQLLKGEGQCGYDDESWQR